MNLTKITGPLTADQALEHLRPEADTLYVVEFEEQDPDEPLAYRTVRGSGAFFHGFIMRGDIIRQITVWKD